MTVKFDLDTVPADVRGRVEALIPDERLADAYVHRTVEGREDFELFDYAVEERENVLLAGPTGSSKTTAFRAYAASRRMPFALIEFNSAMDPGLIIGRTTIGANEVVEFIDGELTLVVRYGGVALFDEANMAHSRTGAAFHQLLAVTRRMSVPENGETILAGQGGLGDPQPNLFGAAYNPRYQGTVRLNEAFLNRFGVPLDWDYDRGVESALLDSTRLLDMAENLRSLAEIRTPVSTNALMEFERHAEVMGIGMANRLFLNRFAAEERGPVARALEANSEQITAELQLA